MIKLQKILRKKHKQDDFSLVGFNEESVRKITEGLTEIILNSGEMKKLEEKIAQKIAAAYAAQPKEEKRRTAHESLISGLSGNPSPGKHIQH